MDITDDIGSILLENKMNKNMNPVNGVDVTMLSLALADFAAVTTFLTNHDYPVAGGLLLVGIVLVYLYHKMGS